MSSPGWEPRFMFACSVAARFLVRLLQRNNNVIQSKTALTEPVNLSGNQILLKSIVSSLDTCLFTMELDGHIVKCRLGLLSQNKRAFPDCGLLACLDGQVIGIYFHFIEH